MILARIFYSVFISAGLLPCLFDDVPDQKVEDVLIVLGRRMSFVSCAYADSTYWDVNKLEAETITISKITCYDLSMLNNYSLRDITVATIRALFLRRMPESIHLPLKKFYLVSHVDSTNNLSFMLESGKVYFSSDQIKR